MRGPAAPRQRVRPDPLSLLTAALPAPADERWEEGLEHGSEPCGTVRVYNDCGVEVVEQLNLGRSGKSASDPFGVQTEVACSLMSGPAVLEELRVSALDELERLTPFGVEREFWTGELAQAAGSERRYLAHPDADVLTTGTTGVSPLAAIGLLEEALGPLPGFGMIHAGRRAAAYLVGQTTREGNLLTTKLGSRLVPGVGYTKTGPDGAPAPDGTAWVYGTGPVTVRLSPGVVPASGPQVVDRATNSAALVAERLALTSWDGCAHFAVLLTLKSD